MRKAIMTISLYGQKVLNELFAYSYLCYQDVCDENKVIFK